MTTEKREATRKLLAALVRSDEHEEGTIVYVDRETLMGMVMDAKREIVEEVKR